MDGLVHYPTIELNDSHWTTHVLLYWDVVATIVPPEVFAEPDMLSDFNLALVKANLLNQLPVVDTDGTSYGIIDQASTYFEHTLRMLGPEVIEARQSGIQRRIYHAVIRR